MKYTSNYKCDGCSRNVPCTDERLATVRLNAELYNAGKLLCRKCQNLDEKLKRELDEISSRELFGSEF